VGLVEAIQRRIADPSRLSDYADITHPDLLPTATGEEVEAAESKIGSPLPPILSRLLLEVANGGFGPGDGLLGVGPGGHKIEAADISLNLPDFYLVLVKDDRLWDKDQVVIVDWGDGIWGTVSLSTGVVSTFRGDTDTYEAQHFEPTGVDLETWLLRWARGESVG
jgi:hypothetical protein